MYAPAALEHTRWRKTESNAAKTATDPVLKVERPRKRKTERERERPEY